MRKASWLLSKVVVCLMSLGVAFSQSSKGAVRGSVMDPSGAIVPGVTLRLENEATEIEMETLTNESGFYSFVAVQPGTYALEAELSGFRMAQLPRLL